jgi:hypothetical protein
MESRGSAPAGDTGEGELKVLRLFMEKLESMDKRDMCSDDVDPEPRVVEVPERVLALVLRLRASCRHWRGEGPGDASWFCIWLNLLSSLRSPVWEALSAAERAS